MPLDPTASQFLAAVEAQKRPTWDEMEVEAARQTFADLGELFGQKQDVHQIEDRLVEGRIPVRVYRPYAENELPVVVYFHGGGWVLGDIETHCALCRRLSLASDAVVVSVDYRRAPETKFPGALEDCWQVVQTLVKTPEAFGVDSSKLVVAGDSAGGNLAAAVALQSQTHTHVRLAKQVLIYPVLDASCSTGSYAEFASGHGLTKHIMQWFWSQYAGQGQHVENVLAAPALAENLSGLPPAHIITAEYDVLRDEAERYADALMAADVAVTQKRYAGQIHGFVHMHGVFPVGIQAIEDIGLQIQNAW